MKEITIWEKSKGQDSTDGQMDLYMKEIGLITELVDMGSIFGKMGEDTMDSGRIMIWKAQGYICGEMVEDMKDSIIMIRNVGLESIAGLMGENTRDGGTKVNSMDLALILIQLSKK